MTKEKLNKANALSTKIEKTKRTINQLLSKEHDTIVTLVISHSGNKLTSKELICLDDEDKKKL